MPEEKKTESRPVPDVTVSIIGTGDSSRLQSGTVGETPDHLPNIVTQVISPIGAVAIRATNLFLTMWVGLMLGAGATKEIPFADFWDLARKTAGLVLAGVILGIAKDLITIFSRLEQKYPLLTGNV